MNIEDIIILTEQHDDLNDQVGSLEAVINTMWLYLKITADDHDAVLNELKTVVEERLGEKTNDQ